MNNHLLLIWGSFLHFVWTGEYISFVMIVWHGLFFIFSLSAHYKDAVKCAYERKLLEARTEAQQDPQYFLYGDVSKWLKKKKERSQNCLSFTWFCWCVTKRICQNLPFKSCHCATDK